MDEQESLTSSSRLRRWMSLVLIAALVIGLLSVAIYVLKPELLMSSARSSNASYQPCMPPQNLASTRHSVPRDAARQTSGLINQMVAFGTKPTITKYMKPPQPEPAL